MQITIQKSWIILVEISENIYRVFLVVVNYIFEFTFEGIEIIKEKSEHVKKEFNNFAEKAHNFIRAIFGFNIYKLQVIKINNKNLILDNYNNSIKHFNNQNSRVRYASLMAPPVL